MYKPTHRVYDVRSSKMSRDTILLCKEGITRLRQIGTILKWSKTATCPPPRSGQFLVRTVHCCCACGLVIVALLPCCGRATPCAAQCPVPPDTEKTGATDTEALGGHQTTRKKKKRRMYIHEFRPKLLSGAVYFLFTNNATQRSVERRRNTWAEGMCVGAWGIRV